MKQSLINKLTKEQKQKIISSYFSIDIETLSKKNTTYLNGKISDIPYKEIVKRIK